MAYAEERSDFSGETGPSWRLRPAGTGQELHCRGGSDLALGELESYLVGD